MTENNARKLSTSLLPKDKIEGKDFLNYIYYDKDGYIVSSNNYVLSALKCDFDNKKNNVCEDKDGKIIENIKYPMWAHLFRGKSFNSIEVDYDKLDKIIDICKEKIKKLPKSKYELSPQGCEMIKFGKVYFRIKNFEKFVKIAKSIKVKDFVYGGNDDRMMAIGKDGRVVINPIVWYNKENLDEEPIDYFEWKEEKEIVVNDKQPKDKKVKEKSEKKNKKEVKKTSKTKEDKPKKNKSKK